MSDDLPVDLIRWCEENGVGAPEPYREPLPERVYPAPWVPEKHGDEPPF